MAYRTHQEVSDTEAKVLSCFPENKVIKRMKLVREFCRREKITTETGYKEAQTFVARALYSLETKGLVYHRARGIWEIC